MRDLVPGKSALVRARVHAKRGTGEEGTEGGKEEKGEEGGREEGREGRRETWGRERKEMDIGGREKIPFKAWLKISSLTSEPLGL